MKKAFTLIELLIFMGILAALLGILSQILASALAVQVESQTASSVHSDGRYLLSRLTYDVRRASNITSPASAGLTSPTLTLTISGSPLRPLRPRPAADDSLKYRQLKQLCHPG